MLHNTMVSIVVATANRKVYCHQLHIFDNTYTELIPTQKFLLQGKLSRQDVGEEFRYFPDPVGPSRNSEECKAFARKALSDGISVSLC